MSHPIYNRRFRQQRFKPSTTQAAQASAQRSRLRPSSCRRPTRPRWPELQRCSPSGPTARPLCYQWLKNGTNYLSNGGNISGATTASLTLSPVIKIDEGSYSVVVTNVAGTVTSSNAVRPFEVPPPSRVTAKPHQHRGYNGQLHRARRHRAVSYQCGGTGRRQRATSTLYSLASVQSSDAGSYDVVVTNVRGV